MPEKSERNASIRADAARGDSLKVIASRYLISIARAAQIIKAKPLTPIEAEGKLLLEVEALLLFISQHQFKVTV